MLAVIMPIAFNVETGAIPRSAEVYVKRKGQGPPWWSSGWDSTCRCRGHGFDPWSGKIPFAVRERSLCAPTREATTTEACAPQWESCSRAPQLEKSPGTETKTQLSHKWSTNNFKRRELGKRACWRHEALNPLHFFGEVSATRTLPLLYLKGLLRSEDAAFVPWPWRVGPPRMHTLTWRTGWADMLTRESESGETRCWPS